MRDSLFITSGLLILSAYLVQAEPVGFCPRQNGDDVTLLEDSEDCSVFYYCNWGNVVKYHCPNTLYFDKYHRTCVPSDQATCYANESAGKENQGDDKDSTADGTGIANAEGKCPPVTGVYAVHLSHRTNCELFYECEDGKPANYFLAFTAVFGMATIDFTYSSWLVVMLQRHLDPWKQWYQNNCNLRLLLPPRKLRRHTRKLKEIAANHLD